MADVQTTIEQMVRVEIDGSSDPIIGQLIGIDAREPQRMNRVSLREWSAGGRCAVTRTQRCRRRAAGVGVRGIRDARMA